MGENGVKDVIVDDKFENIMKFETRFIEERNRSEESILSVVENFESFVKELIWLVRNKNNKLDWAELNQAETVRLHVYAKLRFQV